jgi:hypothetical protein
MDNPYLDKLFKSHQVNAGQVMAMTDIREGAKILAHMIDDLVPSGGEANSAMFRLQEVVFWANAGIARCGVAKGNERNL